MRVTKFWAVRGTPLAVSTPSWSVSQRFPTSWTLDFHLELCTSASPQAPRSEGIPVWGRGARVGCRPLCALRFGSGEGRHAFQGPTVIQGPAAALLHSKKSFHSLWLGWRTLASPEEPVKVIKIRGNYSRSGRSVFSLLKVHGCPTSSGGDCAGSRASLGWERLAESSEELNKASIPEGADGQPRLYRRAQTSSVVL